MRDSVKGGALTEVTFFILLSLYEPNHGYGIMKFVEEKTQGRLVLGAGTLYGAINALRSGIGLNVLNVLQVRMTEKRHM